MKITIHNDSGCTDEKALRLSLRHLKEADIGVVCSYRRKNGGPYYYYMITDSQDDVATNITITDGWEIIHKDKTETT
tara:strand:+ start:2783 stop:3013 length:231 start_codon:yes stop_codon:yes gene_type:complete